MTEEFNQSSYWLERHKQLRGQVKSVGKIGVDEERGQVASRAFQSAILNIADIVRPYLNPGYKTLDIGCGIGRAALPFADSNYDYLGVDISPDAVEQASRNYPNSKFIVSNLLEFQPPHKFDFLFCAWVLVHFVLEEDWLAMLDQIKVWTAPSGIFLLADEMKGENKHLHYNIRSLGRYKEELERRGFIYRQDLGEMVRQQVSDSALVRTCQFFQLQQA